MRIHYILLLALLLLNQSLVSGQVAEEVPAPPYIKSIQFRGGNFDRQAQLPIVRLGQRLQLSFDDIIGDEANYFYTIRHYNADWTPSQLARAEYMDGMDNVRILDYENSVAVLQLYTNYRLEIPNKRTRRLTKTGNYMLRIFNDDREEIFSRKFMVYNPLLTVGAQIKRPRDLSVVDSKQVVRFFVDGGDDPLINPKKNVKTIILQNNNLKTAITGVKPQFTIGNKLEYRYDEETSFWAGNEFFGFENKDIRAATAAVRGIELKSLYHNYLYPNRVRQDIPYTFNPDINGNFVITTLQGRTPRSEAEYVWIHFSLLMDKLPEDQDLYVYGNFNNYELEAGNKMRWDDRTNRYIHPMLLKQGFYNFKYIIADENGKIDLQNQPSGNYWQTENEYQILVYYRRPGGRFDELLGFGNTNSSSITN